MEQAHRDFCMGWYRRLQRRIPRQAENLLVIDLAGEYSLPARRPIHPQHPAGIPFIETTW